MSVHQGSEEAERPRTGPLNALTDVAGLRVGHAQRTGDGWLTGVTVVLAPEGGAVAAVEVRGGGPGTRETDALDPRNLVDRIDAVVLTGGSAFGLDAASGVVAWLEDQGRGFRVGADPSQVVPVVPAATLFDLGRGGDWRARPGADLGRAAVEAAAGTAEGSPVPQGCVGAGTGAVAGGVKGGIGTASVRLPSGVTVAALAAVNAAGSLLDPDTGALYGSWTALGEEFRARGLPAGTPAGDVHTRARERLAAAREESVQRKADTARPLNTTLAVVATDAALTRAQAQKLAGTAHDGLARAIRPVHLLTDGDTVFALSTGRRALQPEHPDTTGWGAHTETAELNAVLAAGADVLSRAVVHAALSAESVDGPGGVFPSYRDLYGGPGAA
ncbi:MULTISPECIES: P1 family peptidase [Streptomyces]|uniref:Peptidase S58 family protein n=1 Tax=Streptomyces dengpaensis TaxID=2049881 RepID=A0ABN5HXR0_9ACTN|nr:MULTISPECIES: P1 family peptidase [Streptomyces]AVH55916.1 peptidase S58 family protein [Streptomyces dengpaensis]PIB12167.1 hydrolase [Streptomyces sp. HG99]